MIWQIMHIFYAPFVRLSFFILSSLSIAKGCGKNVQVNVVFEPMVLDVIWQLFNQLGQSQLGPFR